MSKTYQYLKKTALYAGSGVIVIIALWLSIFFFPQPFFSNKTVSDYFTVYSDKNINNELSEIIPKVEARLGVIDYILTGNKARLFICYSQSRFYFYTSLFFQSTAIQGFGPSFTNNFFLSYDNIIRLGAASEGLPQYTKRRGSLEHALTHELVHHYLLNTLGLTTSTSLPFWKNEGFAEYGTHLYLVRRDSTATLKNRIDQLLDDHLWAAQDRPVRDAYRWSLMIAYLIEIEHYELNEIMHDSVTFNDTYTALMNWYAAQI